MKSGPRGRRFAAAAAGLLATVGYLSVADAATDLPYCEVMNVSPVFATDRTAFCGYAAAATLVVYRTTDGGRTWPRTDKTVLRIPDNSRTRQLIVSANFATDRSVFVATDTTLYASRDAGETFVPLDPLAGDGSGRRVFTPYLDISSGAGVPYVAFAAYRSPARLNPPSHEAVPAALPAYTDRFLVPPRVRERTTPLVVAFTPSSDGTVTKYIYACTPALACPTRRGALPGRGEITGAWLSPAYDTDRTVYVSTTDGGATFHRSTDGGVTFKPWTPLNAALAPVTRALVRKQLPAAAPPALAFGPGGKVYVRFVAGFHDDGRLPPFQVLLRSDDRGARWKTVGSTYDTGGRRRGTVPFGLVANAPAENSVALTATPDGRLFAMGTVMGGDATGAWCSVDGGVRWSRVCPR